MVRHWSRNVWSLVSALAFIVSCAGCALNSSSGQVELPSEGSAGPTQILRLGSRGVVWKRLGQLPSVFQIPEAKYELGPEGWQFLFNDGGGPSRNNPMTLLAIRATLVVAEFLSKLPAAKEDCGDPARWQEQLDYGQKLVDDHETTAARAVLVPILAACDSTTRNKAFASLTQLGSRKSCSDNFDWQQHLTDALKQRDKNEIDAARNEVIEGLTACDPAIRSEVFAFLLQLHPDVSTALKPPSETADGYTPPATNSPPSNFSQLLSNLKKKLDSVGNNIPAPLVAVVNPLGKIAKITWMSFLPLLLSYILICVIIGIIIYLNRNNIEILPPNIVGSDFSPQQFVSIATHVSAEMDEMERVAALGQHAGRANLGTAAVATVAGQATAVAKAFAGDKEQTVLSVALAFLNQPKYRCTGSMYFGAEHAHVLLQVIRRSVRWNRVIPRVDRSDVWHWEGIVPKEELLGLLRQRAYEMLLETARDINQPEFSR